MFILLPQQRQAHIYKVVVFSPIFLFWPFLYFVSPFTLSILYAYSSNNPSEGEFKFMM